MFVVLVFSFNKPPLLETRCVLTSQAQCRRVLFCFQSQVRDARVLVGFRGGSCRHHRSRGGRFRRQRRQGQPEWRTWKHHVWCVCRQVRVQVMVRVGYGAVQLQLRLHLKGEGRHVAMTILWTHEWGEREKHVNLRETKQSGYWTLDQLYSSS